MLVLAAALAQQAEADVVPEPLALVGYVQTVVVLDRIVVVWLTVDDCDCQLFVQKNADRVRRGVACVRLVEDRDALGVLLLVR